MKETMTRLAYCQYLLVSQINYTLTNFANHCEAFSHDAINRYLSGERITPRLVWDNVRGDLVQTAAGYVLFDDTVLDKGDSHRIELVHRPWSGNAKAMMKGIGVVTCVDVNPETDQFWPIDYRLYDPDGDGKSKLDPVRDMLTNVVHHKRLPFYATLMAYLVRHQGVGYFCPSPRKGKNKGMLIDHAGCLRLDPQFLPEKIKGNR
jgi:hypothetical protein